MSDQKAYLGVKIGLVVAAFAAVQIFSLVKTVESVSIGEGKYEVSFTVADKACKVTVQPSPVGDIGLWHWKVSAQNCSAK